MRLPEPQILSRQDVVANPWVRLVRKDVSSPDGLQDFYSLELPDYVAVVAITPSGQVPLIRQYRPAVESFTLELPAGTVEPDETALECCRRELLEETGLVASSVRAVGRFRPDTGRLGNWQHVFLVECEAEPIRDFVPESGTEISYFEPGEIQAMIENFSFDHLLHISALYLSGVLPCR